MEHAPDLMTAEEVAARLGVRPSTVRRWHWQGRIPARKLSHKVVRFVLAEVLTALEPTDRKGGHS